MNPLLTGAPGPLEELPRWLSRFGAIATAAMSVCTVLGIVAASHHHG